MAVDSKQLQVIQRGAGVICSTLQFSDHWLSLFPLTLSVPYENKKVEWKRDFIERSSAIFETDRPVSNLMMSASDCLQKLVGLRWSSTV